MMRWGGRGSWGAPSIRYSRSRANRTLKKRRFSLYPLGCAAEGSWTKGSTRGGGPPLPPPAARGRGGRGGRGEGGGAPGGGARRAVEAARLEVERRVREARALIS